jgi:hypothetical protein
MRNIAILLDLVLYNFQKGRFSGLCSCGYNLWMHDDITLEEYEFLLDYIWRNRPIKHLFKKRNIHPYCSSKAQIDFYFWKQYDTELRIKWLKKHIKRNS